MSSTQRAGPTISTPLKTWFSQFPGFKFTKAPPYQQYNKLCIQEKWDDKTKRARHRSFLRAFGQQYSSPVDRFFLGYAASNRFPYDPTVSPASQWRKLKGMMGWDDPKFRPYRTAHHRFRVAVGEEVEGGATPEQKKKRWTTLCQLLEVEPVPQTALLCKKALEPFMVNIFDWLESLRLKEHTGRIKKPKNWNTLDI